MPDLSYRTDMLEIMDDFDLPSAEITPVLEGLGKMNALFGGHKSIYHVLCSGKGCKTGWYANDVGIVVLAD